MNAFENETLEDDTLSDPAEELRQKTVQALWDVVPETSEVLGSLLVAHGLPALPTAPVARQYVVHPLDDKRMGKAGSKGRFKRTEQQMIQALGGSSVKEAVYVAERVRKLEDKISELMASVSQAAREHIIRDYPHLVRY